MSEEKSPRSKKRPPLETRPTTLMSPESFAKWMSFAVSPEFLTPERFALLRKMSEDLYRDPALLKLIERMLTKYGDEIYEASPDNAELREKGGFGWAGDLTAEERSSVALIPPAAAAAALAPPAAALAAAHAPGE